MKKKTKLLIRDAFFSTILSSILIFLLVLFIFNIKFFNPFNKAFTDFNYLDVFYAENFHDTTKVNTDIVLVNVQNRNRLEIAQVLIAIIKEHPKTIGVDVIFKDRKENVFADSLLASILKHNNIITSYDIEDKGIVYNHSYFGKNEKSGYVDFNFDNETSVIREFSGKRFAFGKERLSFSTQIAKHYLKKKWQIFDYDSKLKKVHTIKFQGNLDTFHHLDFEDILDNGNNMIFKDKIVILGYLGSPTESKTDIEDKFFTPLNKIIAGRSDADMFGATIHANIVNMLISNDFMLTISGFWLGVITFLTMFFSTIFYMKISRKYKVSYRTRKHIYQFVFSTLILVFSFWLFKHNVVLKPAIIIVGIILAGSYFKYYKHVTRYLKTKTNQKWKTYLK